MPRREAWLTDGHGSKGSPGSAVPPSIQGRPRSPATAARLGSPARQPARAASQGNLSRQGSPQAELLAKAVSQADLLGEPAWRQAAARSNRPPVPGGRLPREGPSSGAGTLCAMEPGWMGKTLRASEDWQPERSAKPTKSAASNSTGSLSDAGGRTGWAPAARPDFEKRARATWQAGTSTGLRRDTVEKQDRVDTLREHDQQRIAHKVEHRKQLREDRFNRMLNETFSHNSRPVLEAHMTLQRHEIRDKERRCDLHAKWEENVYEPLESQIVNHMNPPDRALQQTLAGSKSVGMLIPGESFKLQTHLEDDPTWREISDNTWEETFDREASAVLYGLNTTLNATLRDSSRGMHPAAAKSRPVLDPTKWDQLKFQGTLYGRFAQVVEEGPNARMGKRGGPDIFAPSESDGVPTAGKISVRAGPRLTRHHDVGMLRRDGVAWSGEASLRKTWHGASSAAPVQDHYTYETGAPVTDVEFPLGKRKVPHFS